MSASLLHARPSVIVIGSFNPARVDPVMKAAKTFGAKCNVLSPVDLHVVDSPGQFKVLLGDKEVTATELQDDVLRKMKAEPAFVYVANGDSGYIGSSTAGEIFAARALDVTVYAQSRPSDATLAHYIEGYHSPEYLMERMFGSGTAVESSDFGFVAFDLSNTMLMDHYARGLSFELMDEQLMARAQRRARRRGKPYRPNQQPSLRMSYLRAEHLMSQVFGHGPEAQLLSLGFALGRTTSFRGLPSLLDSAHEYIGHMQGDSMFVADGAEFAAQAVHAKSYHVGVLARGRPSIEYRRLVQSGLLELFSSIHIVPSKDVDTFANLAAELRLPPEQCWIVGNSMSSDINPALRAGWNAVHVPIPYALSGKATRLLSGFGQRERDVAPWGIVRQFQRVRNLFEVPQALPSLSIAAD